MDKPKMACRATPKPTKSKYCAKISEGLKIATWLQGDQAKCISTVKQAIKIFNDHYQLESCACINRGSNLLVLAVSSYHLFFLSLESFSEKVAEEEKKFEPEDQTDQPDSNHDDDGISGSHLPNIEASNSSRYGNDSLPQFVNSNCQQTVLKPLKQCVQYLREALSDAKAIPAKLLEGLRLNTLLLTAHNIFKCYSQPDYQYHCARLMIELAGKILPEEKESLLTAYHILIRLYLDFNIVTKARKYLQMAQKTMDQMKLKNFESYQAGLIYLDQCEIELKLGSSEESGAKLKKFLQSQYLNKLTLNRFYLKGLALLLASKFPSSYQFSSDFNEFLEPLHISLTILKRWHRSLLALPPKESDTIEDDHAWFKYDIYSFSMDALYLAKTFYLNIGFPFELSPFFNCLLSLSRRNCFLLWSIKLLKIGASIDLKCDKIKPVLAKLQNGLKTLTIVSTSKTNTESGDLQSKSSSPSKLHSKLVNTFNDIDVELPDNSAHYSDYSKTSDHCIHDIGHINASEPNKPFT